MPRSYSDTTVIIPTLNEEGNIGKLMRLLAGRYPGINIIVSDDGSADGTEAEVKGFASRHGGVVFLDRGGERVHGLTASVVDAALHVRTTKIVVMDADLQHPVDRVGEIDHMLAKYDIVVGVRTYVKDWGLYRRLISKGMAYISYFVFKLRRKNTCSDMMSGFFGIRTALMRRVAKDSHYGFVPAGYKVLLDVFRLAPRGTSVGEVYYSSFHKRSAGKSKLTHRQIICTLVSTFKL